MADKRDGKCRGCGHKLSQHTVYANGRTNRHGSRLVCTVDGCREWSECRGKGSALALTANGGSQ